MSDEKAMIAILQKDIQDLREEVAQMRRILDGFSDLIRPRHIDGHQGRITRWMKD